MVEEKYIPRLKEKYLKEIVPQMIEKFKYKNSMQFRLPSVYHKAQDKCIVFFLLLRILL